MSEQSKEMSKAKVICDIHGNNGNECHFRDVDECAFMPAAWDQYCSYENEFIQERYNDLVYLFDIIKSAYRDQYECDAFWLNHTTLWKLCYIYANDLKPIRRFHNDDGGVDNFRRAAIMARLIGKHRPIFINELDVPNDRLRQDSIIMKINEHYAWHALAHFIGLRSQVFEVPGIKRIANDLRFVFAHRDPQIELLVCLSRLLAKLDWARGISGS
jgi:hypothetical protein